jgi:BirA family biotin operon repressor/biotin-[acetyl-CoA-carboxylase] ligase
MQPVEIVALDVVDSTNDAAKRLLAAGAITTITAIVARGQMRGRGTRGRDWASPHGAGVYLSLAVPGRGLAMPPSGPYTLAAGVATAEAIERRCAGVAVRLKPVNDLVAHSGNGAGKLGGILAESSVRDGALEHLVVGVGVNVARAERIAPGAILPPICLEDLMAPEFFARLDPTDLARAIVDRLVPWIHRAAGHAAEADAVRTAWEARRAALPGEPALRAGRGA